jgi:hypothetical protein
MTISTKRSASPCLRRPLLGMRDGAWPPRSHQHPLHDNRDRHQHAAGGDERGRRHGADESTEHGCGVVRTRHPVGEFGSDGAHESFGEKVRSWAERPERPAAATSTRGSPPGPQPAAPAVPRHRPRRTAGARTIPAAVAVADDCGFAVLPAAAYKRVAICPVSLRIRPSHVRMFSISGRRP